jgi:predicted transcriptional regulator
MKSAIGIGIKGTSKPKRPTAKVLVVSDSTHKRLKDYAMKMGYKTQHIADEAVIEYLKRKEQQ